MVGDSEFCELCGKKTERVVKAKIEGVVMEVCPSCAKLGEVISERKIESFKKPVLRKKVLEKKEVVEEVVDDYGKKIRKEREKRGWKMEDLAKKLNEKESLIHKIENEDIMLNIDLAKKIERLLGIRLVVKVEEEEDVENKDYGGGSSLTLGDLLKKAIEKSKKK